MLTIILFHSRLQITHYSHFHHQRQVIDVFWKVGNSEFFTFCSEELFINFGLVISYFLFFCLLLYSFRFFTQTFSEDFFTISLFLELPSKNVFLRILMRMNEHFLMNFFLTFLIC